jgi:hypothetical protein
MKQVNPKEWWKEVKRLSGMGSSSSGDIRNQIDIENLEHLSNTRIS